MEVNFENFKSKIWRSGKREYMEERRWETFGDEDSIRN